MYTGMFHNKERFGPVVMVRVYMGIAVRIIDGAKVELLRSTSVVNKHRKNNASLLHGEFRAHCNVCRLIMRN